MLHSLLTLAFEPLVPHLPILYRLLLLPHHRLLLLAVLLRLLLPPPLTVSGFNRMLVVSEPAALNCTFFCPMLLTSSVSSNVISIQLILSGSLDSLLCDIIAPTPSLAFFLVMPLTLAAASSFSSGRAFSELSISSLSSFDPCSDYVEVNISLNDSSSFSFLNV